MLSNHVDVLSAELSASTLEHAVCALELLSNADPNAISTACVTLASALCFFFFRLLAQSGIMSVRQISHHNVFSLQR